MVKPILVLALAGASLALAACASQPANHSNQPNATAQNQQTRKVCVSGTPIGSHIVETHCVTMTETQYQSYQKQKQKSEEEDRAKMQRAHQTGPGGPR